MSEQQQYTDPELRERLKEEVQAGGKGGKEGQWSARKAQLLAHEYEKAGGGYVGGKGDSAKHLDRWTEEDWQTSDGSADARTADGTQRYLPKEAWDRMSDAEKRATDRKKKASSEQYVANTPAARRASRTAREPLPDYDALTVPQVVAALKDQPSAADRVRDYERAHKARKGVLRAVS